MAGAVKSNKIKKTATSDFMEIERQRGISVAQSLVINIIYPLKCIAVADRPTQRIYLNLGSQPPGPHCFREDMFGGFPPEYQLLACTQREDAQILHSDGVYGFQEVGD